MGDKPISFRDENGNFVSAADVWNAEKLEELFNTLNPKRKLRLQREKLAKENYIDSTSEYVTDNALILDKYGIKPNIQIQSKDSYASWQMVEAGLGIGLNNYMNSKDRIGDVKILPLIPEQTVEIGITYSREMALAGRIFMEHLKSEYISKLPV